MAKYATGSSDKKKTTAAALCFTVGIFGIHQFYVGKIKAGLVHLLIGILALVILLASIQSPEIPISFGLAVFFGWYLIVAIKDGVRILLGAFRDNVGAPLRQK